MVGLAWRGVRGDVDHQHIRFRVHAHIQRRSMAAGGTVLLRHLHDAVRTRRGGGRLDRDCAAT